MRDHDEMTLRVLGSVRDGLAPDVAARLLKEMQTSAEVPAPRYLRDMREVTSRLCAACLAAHPSPLSAGEASSGRSPARPEDTFFSSKRRDPLMPSKTKPVPALQQLEKLRQAQHEADQAVGAARTKRDQSGRWLPAAQAKLGAYLIKSARDPETERQLRDEVVDLDAMRVVVEQVGSSTRYADRRAVVALEDAMDAAQDAQSAIASFIVEHRNELQEELRDQAHADRDRLMAAVQELSAAQHSWSQTARTWRTMLERWGSPSPAEIPLSPLPLSAVQDIERVVEQVHGGARDPRGILPMPASLVDGSPVTGWPLKGWHMIAQVMGLAPGEDDLADVYARSQPTPAPRAFVVDMTNDNAA